MGNSQQPLKECKSLRAAQLLASLLGLQLCESFLLNSLQPQPSYKL